MLMIYRHPLVGGIVVQLHFIAFDANGRWRGVPNTLFLGVLSFPSDGNVTGGAAGINRA
jgi:hypothetical protein